jgi:hypothetical protein
MVKLLPMPRRITAATPPITDFSHYMRRPQAGFFAFAMLAAACTVPTEMPNWDLQWNLPVNVGDLGVDISKLPLPSGVTIDSTGPAPFTRTGFSVQVSSLPAIVRTLGAQCTDANCQSTTNVSAPKPAFFAPPASTTVALTAGSNLQAATLLPTSQIALVIVNGFGFDPLNPPGGSPGTITIAVNNGAATLGTLTLTGPANTIPAGATRNFTIPLVGTINTASPINVTMTMDSPAGAAGQPVTMNRNQSFSITPTATIRISSGTVTIGASPLTPTSEAVPLGNMSELAERVENVATPQGALLLTVINPMTIGANATLQFSGTKEDETGLLVPITPFSKNVVLPVGGGANTTTTITVPLLGTELREILGANLTVTFGGTTVAGTTVVTPSSKISTTARMRLRVFAKEIE